MECNRDEAVRARDLAEKKMLSKDFVAAKKLTMKAQQLFPDLEGVLHMLTVCEVHCAAEVKINGLDDWYSILQVQPTADESLLKKQYRKFALLLHPDKNKYPGAEAAFKLIGEANRVLLDNSKRSLYDLKRSTSVGIIKPKQPAKPTNVASFPNVRNSFHNVNFSGMNHEQQHAQASATFWTSCPFCRIRYQYYQSIMNKSLRCQNCLKPFIAYDLSSQAVPAAGPTPGYPQNAYVNINQGNQSNVAAGAPPPPQYAGVTTNIGKFSHSEKNGKGGSADDKKVDDVKYEKVKLEEMNRKGDQSAKISETAKKKRNRRAVESSDSEDQDGFQTVNGHANNLWRSNRQKKNVSYVDPTDADDNCDSGQKRPRKDGFAADVETDGVATHREHGNDKHNGDERGNGKSFGDGACTNDGVNGNDTISTECHYPDPEFFEFDQRRSPDIFAVGQLWALYDDLDGMPRFYARIKSVVTVPGFKVRFTWLENDGTKQPEIDWSRQELPIGSGSFELGSSQTSEDTHMFSHLMAWDRGPRKHSYVIHPRKGEIWALFEGWDLKWAYEPTARKSFGYQIVEIISDDTEPVISVMPLTKVEGFVSVFARKVAVPSILSIHPDEKLRFSHMIPSYTLKGNEREGIPLGAFELDPASLPHDVEKIYASFSFTSSKAEMEAGGKDVGMKCNEKKTDFSCSAASSKPETEVGSKDTSPKCHEKKSDPSFSKVDELISPSLSPQEQRFEYPEPEFHDFGLERSIDKLRPGQIWALYSDVDGYPKYYAMIKDVNVKDIKVHVSWLEGCPVLKDEIKWAANELPLSSGLFKILRGKNDSEVYDSLEAFSHIVPARPERKQHYQIYPCVGEVWALYKKLPEKWDESSLQNCEYDVGEIVKANDHATEVLFLQKVKGYTCVFEPKRSDGELPKSEISRDRMLLFSHCIPAFRLTEERGGKLRGLWELDPAALPELLLCS